MEAQKRRSLISVPKVVFTSCRGDRLRRPCAMRTPFPGEILVGFDKIDCLTFVYVRLVPLSFAVPIERQVDVRHDILFLRLVKDAGYQVASASRPFTTKTSL